MKASTKLERVPVKPAITWLRSPGQIISEFLHSSSLFHNLDLCTIWSWRTYLWFDRLPASGWNRTQLHPLDSSSRRSLLVASPSPTCFKKLTLSVFKNLLWEHFEGQVGFDDSRALLLLHHFQRFHLNLFPGFLDPGVQGQRNKWLSRNLEEPLLR